METRHLVEDNGEPSRSFFYGETCPVNPDCKSYKKKMAMCRSYVCREFATNYLARHLQNAHGVASKTAAFSEAAGYPQKDEEVLPDERQTYRDHIAEVATARAERKIEKDAGGYQHQQQKKPQETTAESSTGGKRRKLMVAEPGRARNQLEEYISKKALNMRHFAKMARKFADGAGEFADTCETVVGMLTGDMR